MTFSPFGPITIECPSVKSWERARTDPTGRRFKSSSVVAAVEEWQWLAVQAMKGRDPILTPVQVTFEFRLPTARRVDIDNLAKLPMDALNGIVWADDSQVWRLNATKVRVDDDAGTTLVVAPWLPGA